MSNIHELDDTWHLVKGGTAVETSVTGPEVITPFLGTGWVNDSEAVTEVLNDWAAKGMPTRFKDAAPRLMTGVDDTPVFFWQGEEKVLGKRLDVWNQNPVGSCVGFGFTRAAQNLLLWEIASGEPETWPNAELAPEVTYGGSRVEIGGGRIRGDGSVGAWAAKFLMDYGLVVRGKYGTLDITSYNADTCRRLGREGIPPDVETIARVHPVRAAAMVTTRAEVWAAIGGGKPIAVCSDQGFSMSLGSDGYCNTEGEWAHCMQICGRFIHPRRGKSYVIGNSWANYLRDMGTDVEYIAEDGTTKKFRLPIGAFCTTEDVVARMVAQRDSFALAGVTGWAKTIVDYTP